MLPTWLQFHLADIGVRGDKCSRPNCSRFQSINSTESDLCALHLVQADRSPTDTHSLFLSSFKLYLRSRVGADEQDSVIKEDMSVAFDWLHSVVTGPGVTGPVSGYKLSATNGSGFSNGTNGVGPATVFYEVFDRALGDFEITLQFLNSTSCQENKKTTTCRALEKLMHFRKFHLPTKGIIKNPFAASERILQETRLSGETVYAPLRVALSTSLVRDALIYHQPTFDSVVSAVKDCHVISLENYHDLEFATSYLATALLASHPKARLGDLVQLLKRDSDAKEGVLAGSSHGAKYINGLIPARAQRNCNAGGLSLNSRENGSRRSKVERISQNSSSRDRSRSPCSEKRSSSFTLVEPEDIKCLTAYIDVIHPRLSKSNDVLLLDSDGLGLSEDGFERMVKHLVFTASGKVPVFKDRLQEGVHVRFRE